MTGRRRVKPGETSARASADILRHTGALALLTHFEQCVFDAIITHINSERGIAWPSQARIAKLVNGNRQSVNRALKTLRGLGYLEQANSKGRSSKYRVPVLLWSQAEVIKAWVLQHKYNPGTSLQQHLSLLGDTEHPSCEQPDTTLEEMASVSFELKGQDTKQTGISVSELMLMEIGVLAAGKYCKYFTPQQIAMIRKEAVNSISSEQSSKRATHVATVLKEAHVNGRAHEIRLSNLEIRRQQDVQLQTLRRILAKLSVNAAYKTRLQALCKFSNLHLHHAFEDGLLLLRNPPLEIMIERLRRVLSDTSAILLGDEPTADALRHQADGQRKLPSGDRLVKGQLSDRDTDLQLSRAETKK